MPTQLDVPPEIADKLAAIAMARGVSLEALLLEVFDGLDLQQNPLTESSLEEFERDMAALSDGLEPLPVGYQGTYTREDIYLDHD